MYNLLLDTSFTGKYNHWHFTNCKYADGFLIANNSVFGVEQQLTLPDITKLYFRVCYMNINANILNVKIGIENDGILSIEEIADIKNRKMNSISIVEDAAIEKIKVYIIFETNITNAKIKISDPLLIDLEYIGMSTMLKKRLDKELDYIPGYMYKNLLEFEGMPIDLQPMLEKAKIGWIIKTLKTISVPIHCRLIPGRFYLIKLDFKNINDLGKIYFKYGALISQSPDSEQQYLIFKANSDNILSLEIMSDDIMPFLSNLKTMMLIDITDLNIEKEDILYLPFV